MLMLIPVLVDMAAVPVFVAVDIAIDIELMAMEVMVPIFILVVTRLARSPQDSDANQGKETGNTKLKE